MVNRDYMKEIGLSSHTPRLARVPTYAVLAMILAGISVTIAHVARTAPVHAHAAKAPAPARVASAQR